MLETNNYKKIAILRLSAIGDVCNAISTYQAIHKAYPQTEIVWIVNQTEAELLKPFTKLKLVIYNKKLGIKGYLKIWKELKAEQFDVLLNMQTSLRASLISLTIKAKQKVGFDQYRSREGQRFFINKMVTTTRENHVVDGFMQFAKYLGVDEHKPQWNYPISDNNIRLTKQFIKLNSLNIIISPCSSKREKDWSIDSYIELCQFLISNQYNVILVGSNNSREINVCQQISKYCTEVNNIAGKTTLQELVALIAQVDLIISPDSAAVHIANMVATKVIGLYAYHDPKRTGPYYQIKNVVSVYAKNIPQQKEPLAWATKAKGKNLMQQITLISVIEKINQVLKNRE